MSIYFLVPLVGITLALLLVALVISQGIDWLETRTRGREREPIPLLDFAFLRHMPFCRCSAERGGAFKVDSDCRKLTALALDSEKRRLEKRAGAPTPARINYPN